MPPKQKITKDMILEQAFKITREKGIEAVTARSVAKEVGCSIQPVFCQFATMEDLKQGTFDYACTYLMAEIMRFKDEPDFAYRTSMWVINLARTEPKLFHLLYLSNSYKSEKLLNVMMNYESNRHVVSKMMETYNIDKETCKDIMIRSFLFLYGTATMIATNNINFTDDQVADMMKRTVEDMVSNIKGRIV